MANEAVLVWEKSKPIPFIVANANGIEKGAACMLVTPMTLSGSNVVVGSIFGGITANEKIANDGVTELGAYRDGIFRVYLSGTATAGDSAYLSTPSNYFASATAGTGAALSGTRVVGTFLQSGTTGQQVLLELNPTALGV